MKSYVLDTNVLLDDPECYTKFKEHNVIIPICVLEELDNFKKDSTELGRNARQLARNLDKLRLTGSLVEGIQLHEGLHGTLRVSTDTVKLPKGHVNTSLVDNTILGTCKLFNKEESVVLVSKDINLRVRADALGVQAEDYLATKSNSSDDYLGFREVSATADQIDSFYKSGSLELELDFKPCPNEYFTLINPVNPSQTALAKWSHSKNTLIPLSKILKNGAWGLKPRNKEQCFALDLLLDDSIKLVTLSGRAGSGKSILAVAAALQKTVEEQVYAKTLVSRPIMPMGKDIGYLPGSAEEKLNPWMQPIFDSIEVLMGLTSTDKKSGRSYEELVNLGVIQIEALTYIRGRSIPNQFMILDEGQQISVHEIRTILTRVGEGTKIVITGDTSQIDNPYVDADSCGFTKVINAFKNEKISGHITLMRCERSELSELAANLL